MNVQLHFSNGHVITLNVVQAIVGNTTCVLYKGKTFAYGGMRGLSYDTIVYNEVTAPTDLSHAEVINEIHQ
jgi:hypothetical protein